MVQSSFLNSVLHSATCPELPSTFVLSNLPVDNYFYSDYNAADQVCPRLIVAWPGGNSGVCAYVAPQNGANVYTSPGWSKYPDIGVKGVLHIYSSASLTVPIPGVSNAISINSVTFLTWIVEKFLDCQCYSGAVQRHRTLESNTLSIFNIDLLWQDDSSFIVITGVGNPQGMHWVRSRPRMRRNERLDHLSQNPYLATVMLWMKMGGNIGHTTG
ncbi:hypothetical protein AFLA_010870 [Aspergillus flavus NRRL3357]|nr:hypothetical protein AFLA_010870 [Aspergillus flavus NRRL3357]